VRSSSRLGGWAARRTRREFGVSPNSAAWRNSDFVSWFASATSGRGISEPLGVSKVRPADHIAPTIAPDAQTDKNGSPGAASGRCDRPVGVGPGGCPILLRDSV
jgi:hypothetical protein